MQTQAHSLKSALEQATQSSAKALQAQDDLQEAARRLAVLAEDDRDLRDKVAPCHYTLSCALLKAFRYC